VVTKADLGDAAQRAHRDLGSALTSLGEKVPVVSVSSLPPPSGIGDLIEALNDHRQTLDLSATRTRARRATALRELVAEHGEAALRALGGRRAAERALQEHDPGEDVPALVASLAKRAGR